MRVHSRFDRTISASLVGLVVIGSLALASGADYRR